MLKQTLISLINFAKREGYTFWNSRNAKCNISNTKLFYQISNFIKCQKEENYNKREGLTIIIIL